MSQGSQIQLPPAEMMRQMQIQKAQIEAQMKQFQQEKVNLERLQKEIFSQNQIYQFAAQHWINLMKHHDPAGFTKEQVYDFAIRAIFDCKIFQEACQNDADHVRMKEEDETVNRQPFD